MSIRVDATSWLAGAILVGNAGFGVLGSAIASTGTAGPGYAYNDLALPADAAKEICGRITSWPAQGTLQAFEDTSFIYTRTGDGADSFAYQLYVDGVAVGSPQTVSLAVGAVGAVINLTGAATSQTATSVAGAVSVVPPATGVVNLAGASSSQSAESGSGAVSVTPPAAGTSNLAGSNSAQDSTSSTGTITVSPYVPGVVNLAGSTCVQSAASSTAVVTSGQHVRAPAGNGYSPRASARSVRPRDIQGYNR